MRLGLVWLLGMAPGLATAGSYPPPRWAPDGRWLAYTVAAPAGRSVPSPGWIFRSGPVDRDEVAAPGPTTYRIYATAQEPDETAVVEESRGPLTAPEWSPDGRSLVFGRAAGVGGHQPDRFEVVIRSGAGQPRVLLSRPVADPSGVAERVSSLTFSWSPDGRYLAVPLPQKGFGVVVVRADNGRVLKTLEGALWPAWSPDGTRLAVVRAGKPASVWLMETSFGPPRLLAEIGQAYHPPVWSRDGRSVLAVARRVGGGNGGATSQVDLVRVQAESGAVEAVSVLNSDPMEIEKGLRGVWFSLDRDGEDLFSTTAVEGQPTSVVWFRPRTRETVSRFHPLDSAVAAGGLALSPGGKGLAMRFGPAGPAAPAAVHDVREGRLTPLVPDDPARVEWLSLLIATSRRLLAASYPPGPAGRPVERPSLLLIPGEIPSNHETSYRLRRIGRVGRPLCDRPAGAPEAGPELERFLAEARLFFDVLREDYPAALRSLDAVDAATVSPDHRLRLLSVRAQVFLGLGDLDRAKDAVAYLVGVEKRSPVRFEMTPAGVSLTPEVGWSNGWGGYLSRRLDDLARSRARAAVREEEPLGHRNPDAPAPRPEDVMPFGLNIERLNPAPPPPGPPLPAPAPDDGGVRVRFRRPRPLPPPPAVPAGER